MDVKISVTTNCNARCKTCPVWTCKGEDMAVADFIQIWSKLMLEPRVGRILLNNTGDMYVHPHRKELWALVEAQQYKPVIVTTNAAAMDYVPRIPELIISFNGYDKESYEHTTGLPFEETRDRIRSFYPDIKAKVGNAEIHALAWGDTYTESFEDRVRELWGDFPGRVRVSYKTENQGHRGIEGAEKYRSAERIPCDYLEKLNIWPDGSVILCAHDFEGSVKFGDILTDTVFSVMMNPDRLKLKALHGSGEYPGLCADCNYNTSESGRIVYVKG